MDVWCLLWWPCAAAGLFVLLFNMVSCLRGQKQRDYIAGWMTVRELDSEEMFTLVGQQRLCFPPTTHVTMVTGPVTPLLLRSAAERLQKRHPGLRRGIHKGRALLSLIGTYYFHEYHNAEKRIRIDVLPRENDESWRAVFEDCNNSFRDPVTSENLLWQLKLLLNAQDPNGRHEIVLVSSHTILDGTSNAIFSAELVKHLGEALAESGGAVVPVETLQAMPACVPLIKRNPRYWKSLTTVEKYIPSTWRVAYDFLAHSLPPLRHEVVKPALSLMRDRLIDRRLDAPTTSALVAACRAHHVTVHSALQAALTMVFTEFFDLKPGFMLDLVTPVRMRRFCHKPPPQVDAGLFACITAVDIEIEIEKDAQFWRLAQALQARFHGASREEEAPLDALAMRAVSKAEGHSLIAPFAPILELDRANAGRLMHGILSNLGDMSKYFSSIGLEAADANNNPFKLVEWHTAQTNRVVGGDFFIILYTLRGEMVLDFTFTEPLLSHARADAFVSAYMRLLRANIA